MHGDRAETALGTAQGKALGGAETEGLTPGVWKALEIKRDSRARPVQSATFILLWRQTAEYLAASGPVSIDQI